MVCFCFTGGARGHGITRAWRATWCQGMQQYQPRDVSHVPWLTLITKWGKGFHLYSILTARHMKSFFLQWVIQLLKKKLVGIRVKHVMSTCWRYSMSQCLMMFCVFFNTDWRTLKQTNLRDKRTCYIWVCKIKLPLSQKVWLITVHYNIHTFLKGV